MTRRPTNRIACVAVGVCLLTPLWLGCAETESEAAAAYEPSRTTILAGQRLYTESCLVCHQHDGSGVPGFQPPLIGSSLLAGEVEPLIEYMLLGSQASPRPPSLDGEIYASVMPPYANLTDRDLAAVLTFCRDRWAPDAPPVGPDEVAAVRAAIAASP